MNPPRFLSILAVSVTATVVVGFASAYLEMKKRERLADELAQWQLEEWQEWKENLLEERHREFLGGVK